MLAVTAIAIDRTGWPAWLVTAETIIDAALAPAWNFQTTKFRDVVRDINAVPENQKWMLDALLEGYRRIGQWRVEVQDTANNVWTVRFTPMNGV